MDTTTLYHTRFLDLKQTDGGWTYAHRPNAKNVVMIAPILHEDGKEKTIFLETKRPPLIAEHKGTSSIEFPAGLVGDEFTKESTAEAVKRELLEETGYQADTVEFAFKNLASSAGCTSETFDVAVAEIKNAKQIQKPVTDGGVIQKLYKIDIKDIIPWLKSQEKSGKNISAQIFSGIVAILNNVKK